MSTILLHLDEPEGVHSSDSVGNLEDLWPGDFDGDSRMPTSVETWAGRGRMFAQGGGGNVTILTGADRAGRDTLLVRDATVQAILSLTAAGASGAQTVICRGWNAEDVSYCLQLEHVAGGLVEVRWFWTGMTTPLAGVFAHPGDGKEFLLTATRRWESPTRVVLRYYVNDQKIAELASAEGNIAGATTDTTTVGARYSDNGVTVDFREILNGTIDELLVADAELSHEEIRHTWKRLTEYQPGGVETMVGLIPPGLDWYANPSNTMGRRMKLLGEGLGLAVAANEELRSMFLPDATTVEVMPRWERLEGLSPRPRDSLDTRRARVIGYMSREEGYSPPAVKVAIADLLDQDIADVDLREFTNEFIDGFDIAINDQRWIAGDVGGWSIDVGEVVLHVATGEDLGWSLARYPTYQRSVLDRGDDVVFMAGTLVDWGTLPTDAGVGLYMHDRRVHDLFWFGVYFDGVDYKIAHRSVVAGVEGAVVDIDAAPGAGPLYLRIRTDNNPASPGFTLSYSTDGSTFTDVVVGSALGERNLDWGGFLAIAAGVLAEDLDARVDDFIAWCPGSLLPFCWYAYRDPGLAGVPDMIGADLVVQKIKPAHTHGAAIQRLELLADDPRLGLCDRCPVGGF